VRRRLGRSDGKRSIRGLLLAIWALPGIGIPTLLVLVRRSKACHVVPSSNDRGRYG
jgi:hypothetical protein